MELNLMNFYLEPKCELDFAYELNRTLRKKLEKEMEIKYKLSSLKLDWTLSLNISPSKKIKKINLHGPHIGRSEKIISYSIEIPFKMVVCSTKPEDTYSILVREGLIDILIRDFLI